MKFGLQSCNNRTMTEIYLKDYKYRWLCTGSFILYSLLSKFLNIFVHKMRHDPYGRAKFEGNPTGFEGGQFGEYALQV